MTFEGGESTTFGLVVGADGVHSNVRTLVFGPEDRFARDIGGGGHVAAFRAPLAPEIGRAAVLFEEPDRVSGFYRVSDDQMDALCVFRGGGKLDRHDAAPDRISMLRRRYAGSGWITSRMLRDLDDRTPIFFDSLTQIVMPRWTAGRVCLIGDACGCLTLAAGQGSHLAMAGGYVLASELLRTPRDFASAFQAYEHFLRPRVDRKQAEAARMAADSSPPPTPGCGSAGLSCEPSSAGSCSR